MKSGLTFNGKPFSPQDFTDSIEAAFLQQAKEQLTEQVRSIRDPVTGAFPTVVIRGDSLDDLQIQVEGSPEFLALVQEQLGANFAGEEVVDTPKPNVFLSYGFEDTAFAESIARKLQANGIEVWWAGWCLNAGDSLRQKIEEGIDACTHFLVLLTPNSINKEWVKLEIDSALVNKLKAKCKLIPLRMMLTPDELPALLRGMLSPSVEGDGAISQLVDEIHGISRKPPLGPAPSAVTEASKLKAPYSAAALAVAKYCVENSKDACIDLDIEQGELAEKADLSWDDFKDAMYELRNFFDVHEHVGHPREFPVSPRPELYTEFDRYWRDWDPQQDALRLAADIMNDDTFPSWLKQISEKYGWPPRRLNPAITYLVERGCLEDSDEIGSPPFVTHYIQKTDELRRFMRSRA